MLRVRPRGPVRSHALLAAGPLVLPCVLGPAGITRFKREGDGATPAGTFPILGGFFRIDRIARPRTGLKLRASHPEDGWCDDPRSASYNQPLRLPSHVGHERMWRDDRLYNLGLVVDYNHTIRRKGRGSAIFIHIMAEAGTPTAGCVGLQPADLRRLVSRLSASCRIRIG